MSPDKVKSPKALLSHEDPISLCACLVLDICILAVNKANLSAPVSTKPSQIQYRQNLVNQNKNKKRIEVKEVNTNIRTFSCY